MLPAAPPACLSIGGIWLWDTVTATKKPSRLDTLVLCVFGVSQQNTRGSHTHILTAARTP